MKVDIPPGVEDGTQVRLTREGDAGSHGGLPGNLYIALQVQPHEVFKRRDYDILYDLPVNFAQAALGDEMEVPTLNGPEKPAHSRRDPVRHCVPHQG